MLDYRVVQAASLNPYLTTPEGGSLKGGRFHVLKLSLARSHDCCVAILVAWCLSVQQNMFYVLELDDYVNPGNCTLTGADMVRGLPWPNLPACCSAHSAPLPNRPLSACFVWITV